MFSFAKLWLKFMGGERPPAHCLEHSRHDVHCHGCCSAEKQVAGTWGRFWPTGPLSGLDVKAPGSYSTSSASTSTSDFTGFGGGSSGGGGGSFFCTLPLIPCRPPHR